MMKMDGTRPDGSSIEIHPECSEQDDEDGGSGEDIR